MSNDLLTKLITFHKKYMWRMLKKVDSTLHSELISATDFLPNLAGVTERTWHIMRDSYTIPQCRTCGSAVKWDTTTAQYRDFCSVKCHNQYIAPIPVSEISRDELISRWASLTQDQQRTVRIADPELYQWINCETKDFPIAMKHAQRMWHIQNGMDPIVCKTCKVESTVWIASETRYGEYCSTRCSANDPSIKAKQVATNLELYGVEQWSQTLISSDSLTQLKNKDWLYHQHVTLKLTLTEIAETLNCDVTTVSNYAALHGMQVCRFGASIQEKELASWLMDLGVDVVQGDRVQIHPHELDVYIPSMQVAIELGGIRWHSDQFKSREYHAEKLQKCSSIGIRLFTVFDDEWQTKQDQVKAKILGALGLRSGCKVGARSTTFGSVSTSEARDFFTKYHIQGFKAASVHIGLWSKDALVACMSLQVNALEVYITRFATSIGVPGGFSKLFKWIKGNYQLPITTFADLRYDTGAVYLAAGFIVTHTTKPTYSYGMYIRGCPRRVHRSLYQRKHLLAKLDNFDPTLTEFENCDRQPNLYRVWDCGKIKFTYTLHLNKSTELDALIAKYEVNHE